MNNIIILAGGEINQKLGFLKSACNSPALIPVNTKPLASYLIDFYKDKKSFQIHLAVNSEVAMQVQGELGVSGKDYSLFRLENTDSPIDSLAQVVKNLSGEGDVIVNLVTTIPDRMISSGEVFLSKALTRSEQWSGICLDNNGPHFSYRDNTLVDKTHAFTGVFRCALPELKDALAGVANRSDLICVIEYLESRRKARYSLISWIDCGHETNYYDAKAQLISSRSFNQISISMEDGTLRKKSQNIVKLSHEADYIEMLPEKIEIYFPRILSKSVSTTQESGYIDFEYYGYPTVAEYFLYWSLTNEGWRRFFNRLQHTLTKFKEYPYSISYSAHHNFYYQKTVDRVGFFFDSIDEKLKIILSKNTMINGLNCESFESLLPKLSSRLTELYNEDNFFIMHGDLCFSNMLFDVPSGIIRLIDPRGSFGDGCVGIYGDQKYDLAKLKHSAVFGYDFIVNGLYDLKINNEIFSYRLASRECSDLVAGLASSLVEDLGYKNRDIDLITSLLFLSMCPLHSENPKRQLVMYLHGLSLLNVCLKD